MYGYDYGPRRGWGGPGPGSPVPPGAMRVSDAERAEVTNALIRHTSDGRLTEEEYQERVAKAQAAKTRADLVPLLADLPPLDQPPAPPPPARRRRLPWVLAALLVWATLWWTAAAAMGGFYRFRFPIIPLVVIVLLAMRWGRRGRRRHYL